MAQREGVVGFIGMGLMGAVMARRLVDAGFEVHIWNRSAEKTKALKAAGAQVADSLTHLARLADVICLCVSDTTAVETVVFGENGDAGNVLEGLRKGQIVLDFSSISPDATRALAQRVGARAVQWVDCPVSGGVAGAEAGTLAAMCGGDDKAVDKVRPLLSVLTQRVTHMGPSGAGQITKICNQMLVSCNIMVMAEMFAMAQRAGVDASKIPVALKGGFADSIPLQLTGSRMAAADFEDVKWHVKTLLKDLDMATYLANDVRSSTPMAALAAQLMRLHGGAGHLDHDPATLIQLYQGDA